MSVPGRLIVSIIATVCFVVFALVVNYLLFLCRKQRLQRYLRVRGGDSITIEGNQLCNFGGVAIGAYAIRNSRIVGNTIEHGCGIRLLPKFLKW